MPTMDQAVWASANVAVSGENKQWKAGDLLPRPASPDEAWVRTILRLGGALRTVEVVYTPEELAEQARAKESETPAPQPGESSAPAGQQETAPSSPPPAGEQAAQVTQVRRGPGRPPKTAGE